MILFTRTPSQKQGKTRLRPFLTGEQCAALQTAFLQDIAMPGTLNLEASEAVKQAVLDFAGGGKKVAAICAAPSILGHLGLLKGKSATSYVGMRDQLEGATVLDQEVVVDGNITTSFGLGGAIPFALELVRQLSGNQVSDRVRQDIEYLH